MLMPTNLLKDHIEDLLDSFGEAIAISDNNGIMLHVNKKHEELTGILHKDIMGKSALELVERGVFDVVLNPEVVRTGQPATRMQKTADGRKLILEGNPILDRYGQVVLVITFIRDITKIAELKEQMSSQKELLDAFRKLQHSGGKDLEKFPRVISSRAMKKLYAQVSMLGDTDVTVLVQGETGAGKDVFARRLHEVSERSSRPFIKTDCSSIPENLMETELFGYAPGTFSGANKQGKMGLIEAASGGTLFLDEIGELPLAMQAKLLRVLQDREVVRVGSTTPRKVDVRVVAATNKDLEQEVAKGKFRSDLYYRLKVAVITIPPLRKRRADILPLARGFLGYYAHKYQRDVALSHDAEEALLAYHWPGNVRELENLILGCMITCEKKVISARDLSIALPSPEPERHEGVLLDSLDVEGKTLREILEQVEQMVIMDGMAKTGNMSAVARTLGVDRSTIFRKMKRYEGGTA
ncbi:Fis family transcriptional regulator [Desulfoplanes formicivorans]|uniref:Fis family transcriptional regulator n=2 Tax=Desulfoplanes formicivorans TaxID=1592317 RepID=A0A194ADR3_9BACT|nr:Fis family transcriptional regulator [Desulfoplanes formicivorans]